MADTPRPATRAPYGVDRGIEKRTPPLHDEEPRTMQDPYRILGIRKDASPQQVWRAYERLAWAFNPDRYADLAQWARAREQYRAIETAYQILGDPAVRQAYDQCRTRRQRRRFPRTW